ncbi:hypothetical protein ACVIGA_005092 [Bradyrhizobium sp. USDA 3240]
MTLKKILNDLVRVVIEEAARNEDFASRLEESLGIKEAKKPTTPAASRGSNRRAAAVLDPIELAREGETVLRAKLSDLTVEQLKDIVADYGMDPGKLVLRWKTPDRIVERIVEVSLGRVKKGEGFLSSRSAGDQ